MRRLAKYLKPYTASVLVAIVLLFAQANFDLALPDYLSRIVNNGIQQGGVENAVPLAIRQSQMDRVFIFMSAEEKASVLNDYTLVAQNSADYEAYLEKYPALADGPIYVLNEPGDKAVIERLDLLMAKPLLAVSTIEQVMANPSKAAQLGGGNMGFDLSKIPPGVDVFTMLGGLPEAQLTRITDAVDQQFEVLGDKMVIQAAVGAVRSEYEALGMDMAKVQNNYILRVGGIMLLLTLLSGLSTIAVALLSARTAAGAARDIRRDVFENVENFSNAEFDKFSTASLITRSTNDITQLQNITMMVVRALLTKAARNRSRSSLR